ncbi:MAG: ThuA domain-containing protein [Ktedonobacteraceae bacterium]
MIKRLWLLVPSLVLLLAAIMLVVAGCNLVQTSNVTTSRVKCNGLQTNTGGSITPTTNDSCPKRLLVISKTGGFRHASIKDGKIALRKLAAEHNYGIDFTEDATVFTDANLAHYDAVVFLLTTGTILNDNQKAAFERFIRAGGGYVGVHSASDTEYDWSWYGGLVGAYFDRIHGHSKVMQATIHVTDRTQSSTMMLPAIWIRTDEWYNFATNPRGRVNVLMTVDENSYKGGTMGADHPIAWYHEYDGGRAWYTALGHTSASYYEPLFLAHLWGGIVYTAGGGQRAIATSQVIGMQNIDVFIGNMPIERKTQSVLNFPHS